jgi:hypothetical protein
LLEKSANELVHQVIEKAKKNGVKLYFPVDYITADKFDKDANTGEADDKSGIPDGWMGLDAGPKSRKIFEDAVLGVSLRHTLPALIPHAAPQVTRSTRHTCHTSHAHQPTSRDAAYLHKQHTNTRSPLY